MLNVTMLVIAACMMISADPPQDPQPGDEFAGTDMVLVGAAAPWQINDFKCVALTTCPGGALYEPTVNGQNIAGCSSTGAVCTGTCKYCFGSGNPSRRCQKATYDKCLVAVGGTWVACGNFVNYNCVPGAFPPVTPSGQPLTTDNGCYCGTTPGTTGNPGCGFTDCL